MKSRKHLPISVQAAFLFIVALFPWNWASSFPQSPFYEFTIVAEKGSPLVGGGTIDAIEPGVSINERTETAFLAQLADGSTQVVVARLRHGLVNLSQAPAGRNFNFAQINNQGRVVARELYAGNSLVRMWNAANSGDSQIIASSTLSDFSQITMPTLGNTATPEAQPLVGFLGRVGDLSFSYHANDTGERNVQDEVSSLGSNRLSSFRATAADSAKRRFLIQFTDRFVYEDGFVDEVERLAVYDDADDLGLWSADLLLGGRSSDLSMFSVSRLGTSPAISGSGKIVAFASKEPLFSPAGSSGIYIAGSETTFRGLENFHKVVDTNDTLAFDDAGEPIKFADMWINMPIGVIHVEEGKPGLEDDWAVVSFVATPSAEAWPTENPNRLKLFSAKPGLWTVRIDFERQFQSADPRNPAPKVVAHASSPVRVVQRGDVLRLPNGEGFTVESFWVQDPLALANHDSDGSPRRPARGDHHIAFTAWNGLTHMVVRAAYLDTDEDGLMDIWEKPTRGVDADGDGTPDLRLAQLGANPYRKDLFLELDWLNPRTSGGGQLWSCEPAPGVTARLAAAFATAPVSNPDGSTGITLHVDAGPGLDRTGMPFSINMPEAASALGGGEQVGMLNAPADHPDIVYLGLPGSLTLEGVNTRSLTGIKREFFENRDRGGRELAFKYGLLGDFHSALVGTTPGAPFSTNITSANGALLRINGNLGGTNTMRGQSVIVTHGKGAGQVQTIAGNSSDTIFLKEPFSVIPDSSSRISLLSTSSGQGEGYLRPFPDYHGRPGNDIIMSLGGWGINDGGWLANGGIQWRTLMHQLGHTFGLRHGGVDHDTFKGSDYRSLMNYSWLLKTGSPVASYSQHGDPTFDDWGYVKFDFPHSAYHLGNAFGRDPEGTGLLSGFGEPTVWDFEQTNGAPPDLQPPTVALIAPSEGASFPSGRVDVDVLAGDEAASDGVKVYFDRDGNGKWDDADGEIQDAVPGGVGRYSASFPGVHGPWGARRIMAIASDASANRSLSAITVLAGSGAGAGTIIRETSGTFSAQGAGAQRQIADIGPITIPSSGLLTFTVSASPPVRLPAQSPDSRFDAAVTSIRFSNDELTLRPVSTAPGRNPSVSTSAWNAPAAGSLNVRILGPAIFDDAGFPLAHPAQNYELTVTFQAIDITPPIVGLIAPGAGEFAEVGVPFSIEVEATDDFEVATVVVKCDLNGDGDQTDLGESITSSLIEPGIYRATFGAPSGAPGVRAVEITGIDTAGLDSRATAFIDVRERDTTAPTITVASPPSGWPVQAGDALSVEVSAFDNVELSGVEVAFDVNGDGTVSGETERVEASKTGINRFTVAFTDITGPNGPRSVTALATDTSGNVSPAESIVTVGGVEPVTETIFLDDSGSIPAQTSSGSRQVISYPALDLPGSGTVTFTVTATPPVRRTVQNIPRADPFVQDIVFDGSGVRLSPTCNAPGSDPAVCTTSYTVDRPGSITFPVLGPGQWNTFGEFVGHGAQSYTLQVDFTSVDITPPEVAFVAPVRGADLSMGSPLTVRVNVTDKSALASVLVHFDVNGDGDADDFGESKAASHTINDIYEASFSAITGAPANRTVEAVATDESFNTRVASISVGTGGVGAGEIVLSDSSGTIPAQPNAIQGGQRQTVALPNIAVPGMGRVVFRVEATPPVRRSVTNLERHDPTVAVIRFNGETVQLEPVCNPPGSDPAVCVSTWDSPGAGTLEAEILGPVQYNIWGEFTGHSEVLYDSTVAFLPGPAVTNVTPSTGSVAGGQQVIVRGSGFALNPVVLFDGIPATGVTRNNAGELTCVAPPGTLGSADVRVINPDPDGLPWNHGIPYGLFGTLAGAFSYQAAQPPGSLDPEQLLGTWSGSFSAVGREEPQQRASLPFSIPGAGRMRFETYAFIPIFNPIPGPFNDPTNLDWHNESSAVRSFTGGNGTNHVTTVLCTDLSFPYGPVICDSTQIISESAAGNGTFTILGPARWNAFWRQFDDFVMLSAPAQDWVTTAWFAARPTLTSITPNGGSTGSLATVRGSDFAHGIRVWIGGSEASIESLAGPTELTCRIPAVDGGMLDVDIELSGMTARLPGAYLHDGTGGPSEDSDGDGLQNLIEWFMGLDPDVHDSAGALTIDHVSGTLLLVYRRARDTGDLVGRIEWSDDLSTWQSDGVEETIIRDVPGENFVTLGALLPTGQLPERFVRLKVSPISP